MRRHRLPLVLVAVAVGAWIVEGGWDLYPHQHLTDLPVYEGVADAIAAGEAPYRDIPFEYPPLAAGLVTLARIVPLSYSAGFSALMLLALCATVAGVVATARALGLGTGRQAAAGGIVALVPFVLGDFVATRFDLAVAALLAWMLWAAVSGRFGPAWALLAAAVALKLAPVLLAPLLLMWHRRHRGGRPALGALGAAAAAVVATFLPFVALSPGGVWRMLEYHLDRPLQIESLGSAYLLGLHALADIPLRVETTFGSQNLIGDGPDAIAAICTALVVVGVVAVFATTTLLLRRVERSEGAHLLVAGVAATVGVSIAAGKVLSPQFLVWLLPAAFLVTGRYGPLAFATAVCALLATQLYFPVRYWDLVDLETPAIALLVIRDALLVALVALAWPRPHAATHPSGMDGRAVLRPDRAVAPER